MDTSSSDAREQIQRAFDDEIKKLEESIRTSKYRRNTFATISRLPSETLAAIFSFLSPSAFDKEVGYLDLIHITHVCRNWRETALNYPHLWSRINFNKLTTAGNAEILARAKMMPLHFQATPIALTAEQLVAFEQQLDAHISHTHHLCLLGVSQTVLWQLVSPAPVLESLTLSCIIYPFHSPDQIVIHDTLFNSTAPKLTKLVLLHCDVNWKSPLLKGLRTLEIVKPFKEPKLTLEDWLDALSEMTQLHTLILKSASPISSIFDRCLSEPWRCRIITPPSLTQFYIASSAADCSLVLSHLMLPTLTSLRVDAKSHDAEGSDVRLLISHVARNAIGPQDTAPLQSIAIRGGGIRPLKILAWTSPDPDIEDRNRFTTLWSERVVFAFTAAADIRWRHKTDTRIWDALFTQLPTGAISTLSVEGYAQVTDRKEFWISHASSFAMLKRARLAPCAVKAFIKALTDSEDSPPNRPRFPRLTKLILQNVQLTALKTYRLHDVFIKRAEQGAPLGVLDLCTCRGTERAVQLLARTVSDVQGPVKPLRTRDPAFFDWKGGVDFFNEKEKRDHDDKYEFESDPWDDSTDYNEDEDEDGWDEHDEDSDPYDEL